MTSAFGIDHGDEISKAEGRKRRAAAVGLAGAAVGATVIGRNRANRWGASLGTRMSGHADWSAGRAAGMKNPKFKQVREGYAVRLKRVGDEVKRSDDTKEGYARAASATGVGTAAGGISYGRNKKK